MCPCMVLTTHPATPTFSALMLCYYGNVHNKILTATKIRGENLCYSMISDDH